MYQLTSKIDFFIYIDELKMYKLLWIQYSKIKDPSAINVSNRKIS